MSIVLMTHPRFVRCAIPPCGGAPALIRLKIAADLRQSEDTSVRFRSLSLANTESMSGVSSSSSGAFMAARASWARADANCGSRSGSGEGAAAASASSAGQGARLGRLGDAGLFPLALDPGRGLLHL